MKPRRKRSERTPKPAWQPPPVEPELPRTFEPRIREDTHPSSPEFLAAYNAYWDAATERGDEPMAAPFWRKAALAVVR